MRRIVFAGLLLMFCMVVQAETSARASLPKRAEVFVVAGAPGFAGKEPYFTAQSLMEALPAFRAGEAELKVGARRIWQSGVIVLKNKKVLFWTTCRKNFIHVLTDAGIVSFIIGDGKDNL